MIPAAFPEAALPPPTSEAAAHSNTLRERIIAAIDTAGGAIPFREFMRMALYEPGLGYYAAGAAKFGIAGDFVTAPEISPLYGRCVARQIAEVLRELGSGDVLEFGAGNGRLAVDVLHTLADDSTLPTRYRILEISPDLHARQQKLIRAELPAHFDRVEWLERLPESFTGVVLANEVLDAMPVTVFRREERSCAEMYVAHKDGNFRWEARSASPDSGLTATVAVLEKESGKFTVGYTSEYNPLLKGWWRALGDCLQRGLVLIADYGYPCREYYHPQRTQGTLLCHYRHRVHDDPFLHVGLQDITASVDFTAVAESAQAAGFTAAGYSTQAHFLLSLGLAECLEEAVRVQPDSAPVLSRQVQQLTLPGEMGERFKVLAATKGLSLPLRGYTAFNALERL